MRTSANYAFDGDEESGMVGVSLEPTGAATVEFRGGSAYNRRSHYVRISGLSAYSCQELGQQLLRASKEIRKLKKKEHKIT